jgi:hypothetical protein
MRNPNDPYRMLSLGHRWELAVRLGQRPNMEGISRAVRVLGWTEEERDPAVERARMVLGIGEGVRA